MGRTVAVVWHASFCIAAGVLYFFFALPRWPELVGDTSHTLGTALRIVTGALIGLAALPVVFTLLRTRRPEFGTPQLALTMRTSSIALHVLAGALIIGTAISEIWLTVDNAGQWLFGSYAAAAAVALLGIFAFYLAFVAELPPPPPKPLKPKKAKQSRRSRRKAAETTDEAPEDATEAADDAPETATEDSPESESDDSPAEVTAATAEPESTSEEPESTAQEEQEETAVEDKAASEADDEAADTSAAPSPNGRLRNRRLRRLRGRVAVED
jgi:hypothetical protein